MSWQSLLGPVGVVLGAYLVVAGYLYVNQPRMIYFPNTPGRALAATPGDVGLGFESVELETDDRERLHGWFVPASDARGTLLFLHGNAGNISHRLDSLRLFHDLGLSTLIIDYRGYGQSTGRPTEQGTYRDGLAAWREELRRFCGARGMHYVPVETSLLFEELLFAWLRRFGVLK